MEAYSRNDNLIIRGLPERTAAERASDAPDLNSGAPMLRETFESVERTTLEFFNSSLGVAVTQQDVSIAHRIRAGPNDKVRPIIVRFNNRKVRNAVFRAKKMLKNDSRHIFISEHLAKLASELFFEARKYVKDKRLNSAWTMNGQVYAKTDSNPTTRAKLIKCRADLDS